MNKTTKEIVANIFEITTLLTEVGEKIWQLEEIIKEKNIEIEKLNSIIGNSILEKK